VHETVAKAKSGTDMVRQTDTLVVRCEMPMLRHLAQHTSFTHSFTHMLRPFVCFTTTMFCTIAARTNSQLHSEDTHTHTTTTTTTTTTTRFQLTCDTQLTDKKKAHEVCLQRATSASTRVRAMARLAPLDVGGAAGGGASNAANRSSILLVGARQPHTKKLQAGEAGIVISPEVSHNILLFCRPCRCTCTSFVAVVGLLLQCSLCAAVASQPSDDLLHVNSHRAVAQRQLWLGWILLMTS
jgi:hypothetical protein